MNEKDVKKYLREKSFVPSKKMGQNFLINQQIQQRIVESAQSQIDPETIILEIGPGLGAITKFILQFFPHHDYVGVEMDARLAEQLVTSYSWIPTFHLVRGDFLKLNLKNQLLNLKLKRFKRVYLLANLPYSTTSPIIRQLLIEPLVTGMTIMVQREFAERLQALPRTKMYNAFTALVALVYECRPCFNVGPENFIPRPNVDSSVIQLVRKQTTDGQWLSLSPKFIAFVQGCFANRRKTLWNNLLGMGYSKDQLTNCWQQNGYLPTLRAEELPPVAFVELANQLMTGTTED